MDEDLIPANQRIDHMSFKDLTAQAAAAMKSESAETAAASTKANEPKAADKNAPMKPKTS